MISFATTTVFGVDWIFLKPYIVARARAGRRVCALRRGCGRALPGHRSAEPRVRRHRRRGRPDRLLPRQPHEHGRTGSRTWRASLFGAIVNVVYGMLLGPAFAGRDPLVKMMGTLGLALILLGVMAWRAPAGGAFVRVLQLPTSDHRYTVFGATVKLTQILALAFALILTVGTTAFLRFTKLGTAMRALASDREITATLGVPVRRVELAAWLGSGIVCGAAGLLLADLFTSLDYTALTFLVISSLAAALIGRLRSLWVTLAGGLAVGLAAGRRDPVLVDLGLPDGGAVRARDHRAALSRSPPHGHPLADGRVAACSISQTQPRARWRGASSVAARSSSPSSALRCFVVPAVLGGDWIKTLTAVAIYAVVAAGLVTLYGRVGMISLGQIALLAIGTWTATRISYAADLPFPVLLLVTGRDHVRGRRADRPAGAPPERPLPRADHADGGRRRERRADHDQLPERRSRLHRPHLDPRPVGAAARRAGPASRRATRPTTATRSSSARSCSC